MTSYPIEALQELKNQLIRKSLNGSVFVAEADADNIDLSSLFDGSTGDLRPGILPDDFHDFGFTTDAGVVLARAITESPVTSWQSTQPTRSDRTADTTTLQVQAQETKLITLGTYFGVDLDSLVPANNGFMQIPQDEIPKSKYYRVLEIAVDETELGEIVMGRYLPMAKPTAFGNQSHAKSNDPVLYDVTFTGFVDSDLSTSSIPFFGGAGWKALLVDMGLTAAAPSAPVIVSALPTALPTAGGTLVRISGRGFTGTVPTTGVKFAGTNSTQWDILDDETIVAIAPAHAAGSGPLVVTNGTGPSTTGPTVTYS